METEMKEPIGFAAKIQYFAFHEYKKKILKSIGRKLFINEYEYFYGEGFFADKVTKGFPSLNTDSLYEKFGEIYCAAMRSESKENVLARLQEYADETDSLKYWKRKQFSAKDVISAFDEIYEAALLSIKHNKDKHIKSASDCLCSCEKPSADEKDKERAFLQVKKQIEKGLI